MQIINIILKIDKNIREMLNMHVKNSQINISNTVVKEIKEPLKKQEEPLENRTGTADMKSVGRVITEEINNDYVLCGVTTTKWRLFAKPVIYVTLLCISIFFQSMVVNGFINSSIATLEKRFGLSSSESSIISSIFDIGCLLVVLPVSYFGERGYKPHWVGFGTLMMGFGALIVASPHILASKYEINYVGKDPVMCHPINQTDVENCEDNKNISQSNFKYVLYLGMLIVGMGSSPLYTLGIAHVEETVDKRTSGLYIGFGAALVSIGPAIGYLLSGVFLTIYVDLKVPFIEGRQMTPDNREIWVGAWWLGFVIAGICQLLVGLLLIMFPRPLKIVEMTFTTDEEDSTVRADAHNEKLISRDAFRKRNMVSLVKKDISNIGKIILNMLRNLTYTCLNLANILTFLYVTGLATYGPKYFTVIFGLKDSLATVSAGIIGVPALTMGALMGGFLLNRFSWKLPTALTFMAITSLAATPLIGIYLLKCPTFSFKGIDSKYSGEKKTHGLIAPCNSVCKCSPSSQFFVPGCSNSEAIYFSPCFAGCSEMITRNNKHYFRNCSCINDAENTHGYQLTSNTCNRNPCTSFYIFAVFFGVFLFITYLRGVPQLTATMRSVEKHEISVALAFQSIVSRLFGSIPGPILVGSILDSSCKYWGRRCGKNSQCLHYNKPRLHLILFFLGVVLTCLNGLCFLLPRLYIICVPQRIRAKSKITVCNNEI